MIKSFYEAIVEAMAQEEEVPVLKSQVKVIGRLLKASHTPLLTPTKLNELIGQIRGVERNSFTRMKEYDQIVNQTANENNPFDSDDVNISKEQVKEEVWLHK